MLEETSSTTLAARKKRLEQELDRYLDILAAQDQPEQVILFGSLASGQLHQWSDIDLVVIKQTDLPFWPRLREVRQRLCPQVSTNILVYTPVEFTQLCQDRLFFQEEILAKGRVVYERNC